VRWSWLRLSPMPKSAELTVTGLGALVVGAVLLDLGRTMYNAAQLSSSYGHEEASGPMSAIMFGAIIGLAGLVIVLVGIYRALSKIDALPLPLNAVKDHEQETGDTDNDGGKLGDPAPGAAGPSL
jgi:hypothetical protein